MINHIFLNFRTPRVELHYKGIVKKLLLERPYFDWKDSSY